MSEMNLRHALPTKNVLILYEMDDASDPYDYEPREFPTNFEAFLLPTQAPLPTTPPEWENDPLYDPNHDWFDSLLGKYAKYRADNTTEESRAWANQHGKGVKTIITSPIISLGDWLVTQGFERLNCIAPDQTEESYYPSQHL